MSNESHCNYDLVVIGAGVSGLSLAAALPDLSILILEAEDRVGGRVYSRQLCDVAVELGAIFPLMQDDAKSLDNSSYSAPVALYQGGLLFPGSDPIEVLKGFSDSRTSAGIQGAHPMHSSEQFYDDLFKILRLSETDAVLQATELYSLIDAFHRVIHPGPLSLYSQTFARQALTHWPCEFNEIPNHAFVDSILARLSDRVVIRTGCKVTRLVANDGSFELDATDSAGTFHIGARHGAITTPVRQLLHILRDSPRPVPDFYRNIVYVPGMVCAVVFEDIQPLPRYVVSADQLWSSMIPMHRGGRFILNFYLTDSWATKLWSESDDSIVSLLLRSVREMGVEAQCLGFVVQRWPELGPILSDNLVSHYSPGHYQLSPRLWYAGEMALYKPAMPMAYGVNAAVRAGELVASEINETVISSSGLTGD